MKKIFLILFIFLMVNPANAEMTQQEAKQLLKEKGYLYGCTPINWNILKFRGGFNWAVMQNNTEIMELEKLAGLNITKCGIGIVNDAIAFKKDAALDFSLKNGFNANIHDLDHSLLTFAIYRKNPNAVKILIENGADVNMVHCGKHPLNSAIKKNQPEMVKMLLEAGAEPNEQTEELVKKSKNSEIKKYFSYE